MAVENRRNNQYYYRKIRINGRMVSEYVGRAANPVVQLIARKDQNDRERKAEQRQAERLQLAPYFKADQDLQQIDALNDLLVSTALLEAGYHKHKGQWRKKRIEKTDNH